MREFETCDKAVRLAEFLAKKHASLSKLELSLLPLYHWPSLAADACL